MGTVVELRANGEEEVHLNDGVPLTLHVAISSSDATPVTLGAPLAPWWEKLAVFGSDGRQLFWPFEVLEHRPESNAVTLSPGDRAELELGIGPEDLGTVHIGTYELRVRVAGGAAAASDSNEVVVEITGKPLTTKESADPAHLVTMAAFLTKRGRHIEARAAIDELVASGGGTAAQLLQMAQLQERQGDIDGAIQTYEHAEARYWEDHPKAYEGPEIIATRILRLRQHRAQNP